MKTNKVYPKRENRGGREGTPPFRLPNSFSTTSAVSSVRRLGYVAAKMHESIMSALLNADDASAESFNDAFKPFVDGLLNFDVESEEVDDGTEEV